MKFHPRQAEVASDSTRFRVIDAGRRWGKDVLGIEEAIGVGLAMPGGRIPYIAPTIGQARDIVWEPLKKRLRPIATSINESRLEISFRTNKAEESRIVLRGWHAIETERGMKNAFAVMTEVALMPNFFVGWQEVLRPTLTDLKGGAMFLSTPKGYNHFFDLHEFEKDPKINANKEWRSWHFTTYDNPYIDRSEIDSARAELGEDRFAQEYLAEFRKMEGLVYKDFNRAVHIFDDFTERRPIAETLAGVDFGFTNPSVILKIEHDVDNHYWVSQEWYKTQKTTPEIIEAAKHMGIGVFYPDPAEPDRIEEMKRAGLNVREEISKDIEAGIVSVQELLRKGQLHVHKSCLNLISEFESYRYPDKRPDNNAREVPIKEHDHALDALRYVLHQQQPAMYQEEEDFNMYAGGFN